MDFTHAPGLDGRLCRSTDTAPKYSMDDSWSWTFITYSRLGYEAVKEGRTEAPGELILGTRAARGSISLLKSDGLLEM